MRCAAVTALLCATALAQEHQPLSNVDGQTDLQLFQLRAERIVGKTKKPEVTTWEAGSVAKEERGFAATSRDNVSQVTEERGFAATVASSGTNTSSGSSGRITAYIQFGKVGSSSVRNIFEHRAEVHGWPVVDEDATCKKHVLTGEDCEHKKAEECRVAKEEGLPCGKRLCLAKDLLPGSKERPDCADEPTDSVVQVTFPNYCEALEAHSSRPCSYVTLLREPVSRMISEYNYWCLDCLDKIDHRGIFCQENYHCPNDMSITDWAQRHGNDYTRRLATRKGHENLAEGFYSDVGYLNSELTEDDFEAALKVLQADNMLALSIEELEVGADGKPSGLQRLSEFLEDPTVLDKVPVEKNKHDHAYQPTAKELKQLRRILHYDVRLYEALHA